METTNEAREAFITIIEDMAASPIVMSAKKIKAVLKCLAYFDELRAVVDVAKEGFDFAESMKRAYVEVSGSAVFRMPVSNRDKVSLVICLLLEFDSGKREFYDFLTKCYPSSSAVESYIQFCIKVLRPFKEAFLAIFDNGDAERYTQSPVSNDVEFAGDGLNRQTEYLLVTVVEKVKVANLNEDERADLLVMLEGFASAIDSRDSLMIRAVWLGVKKALLSHKMCAGELAKLDDALRLYLVVK